MTPSTQDARATGLVELAVRCEQATGADRELDGCIWWATRSPAEVEAYDCTGFVRRCIEQDGSAGRALQQFFDSSNSTCLARIAFANAYTASLDAAMTLVPEGWFVTIVRDPGGIGYAGVDGHPDSCGPPCATPALALTAAALRAIASEKPNA